MSGQEPNIPRSTAGDLIAPDASGGCGHHNVPKELLPYAERMGETNLLRRLQRQQRHEAGLAWQGQGIFRFERLLNIANVIRTSARLTGLYHRGYRNFLDIRLVENTIRLHSLPRAFHGFRILHISDLHTDLDPALPDVLIPRLQGLHYDLCVNTGDFRNRTLNSHTASMEATRRIQAHITAPTYGVLGNHDFLEKVADLEAMGIRILLNESIPLQRDGDTLWLSGIDDPHFYQSHDIARARQSIPDNACAIMLAHSPCVWRATAEAGYQLMLSGHTHGGQICLPGGFPVTGHCQAPRALWRGPWQRGSLVGYTSPGTGAGTAPLRFHCPGELTIHTLQPAS